MSQPFFNPALEEHQDSSQIVENNSITPTSLNSTIACDTNDTQQQLEDVAPGTSIFDLKPFNENEISQNSRKVEEDIHEEIKKRRQVDFFDRPTWHKFIGSLIVEGTATRPSTKPFVYGSKLSFLVTALDVNKSVKIKRSMGSLIKFWDPITRREIGRLPERYASIIYPFLCNAGDTTDSRKSDVSFKATVVYSEPKRISVGDSFLVQIDCFLNSSLFESNNGTTEKQVDPVQLQNTSFLSQMGSNSRKPNNILFGKKTDSDEHEETLHKRRKALMTLFDELKIKPVITDPVEGVEELDTNNDHPVEHTDTLKNNPCEYNNDDAKDHDGVEVIDLDDSEDESEYYKKKYESSTNSNPPEELNVNQLQNIYKITQSTNSVELPETLPSGGFQFSLRKYQAQGLSWMLKREHEFEKIIDKDFINSNSNKLNPLWKKFEFPSDSCWSSNKHKKDSNDTSVSKFFNEPKYFYANLYSGDFSLDLPTVKLMTKGGILADEMGLGKTISTLALISTVSKDSEYDPHEIVTVSKDTLKPYAFQTTLVIVPMSLLYQWKSEFEASMSGSEKYCEIFYGDQAQKKNLIHYLCNNKNPPTVLLTTYGVVQSEFAKYAKTTHSHSGLFSVKFFRLVIDEGHSIRNKQTKTAKSVFELCSNRKWVLTGTPIINKLDDLYALVKFLDLAPFSEPGFWRTSVSEPFEMKKYSAALGVVSTILEPVLLRRTKNMKDASGKPLVELPEKKLSIEYVELSTLERRLYQSFLQVAEKNVRDSLKKGVLLKNYSSILVHILRLRQLCCDLNLLMRAYSKTLSQQTKLDETIIDEDTEELVAEDTVDSEHLDLAQLLKMSVLNDKFFTQEELKYLQNEDEFFGSLIGVDTNTLEQMECQICLTSPIIPITSLVFTECHHTFCSPCMDQYLTHKKLKNETSVCPMCRTTELAPTRVIAPLQEDEKVVSFQVERPPQLEDFTQSTKIAYLIRDLYELYDTEPNDRVIIFSQFSTFLDVIQSELNNSRHEGRFEVSKFDGRLNLKERQVVLQNFDEDSKDGNMKILLISLKAGGVGLNLTKANKAFLMDIWWNAGIEDQAIDRIHRIGQNREVQVKRYIVKDSVEEKMLKIQERKRMLGEIVEGDAEERRQRRIEEIKSLFE